jgi:ATP-dependent helicase/nuclease subunit A
MSSPSSPFSFPEVRVVEASAGSGKTYALSKRYIQLLLHPSLNKERIPLRFILAITFTNKAAFEMKERILEILKLTAMERLTDYQKKDILEPIGLDEKKAAKRAFEIMEQLIHHYNFFQVQTIDKFINAILSGSAFKIGLTANFKIRTDSNDYLEHSLDILIDKAGSKRELAKYFEQFLQNYLYLENRTGWFPKKDMLAITCDLFQQMNNYGLKFKAGGYNPEILIKKKRVILEAMKDLRNALPEKTDKKFLTSFDAFLREHAYSFDIDSVPPQFSREAVPLNKGAEMNGALDKLWVRIHSALRELCEEEAYHLFSPYSDIFEFVMKEFQLLSSKDDVLFLSELNTKAASLFDEQYVTVQELYYRLATRLKHFLIDEFQDTSFLQWHNIEKMAEEALSTGGTLFYVGDRKQAIYQFRGGDIRLFDQIKDRFQMFNVQEETLTQNWRSSKAVVQFNNHIFSPANIERFLNERSDRDEEKNKDSICFDEADLKQMQDVYAHSQQNVVHEEHEGCVAFEYIDLDKKDERNQVIREKLIALLRDVEKRFQHADIALLTRGNKDVEELTRWLTEEGIGVESERTSNIKENYLIEEITAFLNFLHSPIDNLCFTKFILGDIFSCASGIPSAELHHFVFKLRPHLKAESGFYIYREFQKVYPEIWDQYLEELFKSVDLYPLYELIISFYNRYNVLKNFESHQGFLMHFLELVKKKEDDCPDVHAFLEYLENLTGEDLYVRFNNPQAVKILTIHKAKGLEFPVVILPFLGMEVEVGHQGDMSQSYILEHEEDGLRLMRVKKEYTKFSPTIKSVYEREYKKAFLTELNSIYVGLTRPRYELYGFIPKKAGNCFNPVKFLIPETLYKAGQAMSYEKKRLADKTTHHIAPSTYHNWIEYLKDEFVASDALRNRSERLKGEAVHFLLSAIKNLNLDKVESVLQKAVREVQVIYAVDDCTEHVSLVKDLIAKEEFRKFFYIDEGEILTEHDVMDRNGHTKRIDRIIVTPKEVKVIDYKFSFTPGDDAYVNQVREYMALMKDFYPGRKISGHLVYVKDLLSKDVE